jgi:hypothetical protein
MASYSGPKTFGIELEYIAVYPVGLFDKGDDHFDVITALSLGCIAKGIKSTGHASLDDDESINGEDGDYTVWSFVDEGGLELSATEKKALGSTDNEWGMDENYEIISLEVASRMLHFEDPNWQTELRLFLVSSTTCATLVSPSSRTPPRASTFTSDSVPEMERP